MLVWCSSSRDITQSMRVVTIFSIKSLDNILRKKMLYLNSAKTAIKKQEDRNREEQ